MPIDTTAWNQAAQTAVAAGAVVAQGKLNKKTMAYNREMMDKQRNWAVEDWNKTNEYNSPINQRARLEAAGMNANLMFGNPSEAQGVRSSPSGNWNPQNPDVSPLINSMQNQVERAVMQQQIENMQTQNLKTIAEIGYITQGTTKRTIDNYVADKVKDYSIEGQRLGNLQRAGQIENMAARTQFTMDENERQKLKNVSDMKTAVQVRMGMVQQRLESEQRILESKTRQGKMGQDIEESKQRVKNLQQNLTNLKEVRANLQADGNIKNLLQTKLNQENLNFADDKTWEVLEGIMPLIEKRVPGTFKR